MTDKSFRVKNDLLAGANVGIGNTSPGYPLVIGGTAAAAIEIRDGGDIIVRNVGNSGNAMLYCDTAGQLNVTSDLKADRNLLAANSIGVGINSPGYPIDVYRNTTGNYGAIRLWSGSSSDTAPRVIIKNDIPSFEKEFQIINGAYAKNLSIYDATGSSYLLSINQYGNMNLGTGSAITDTGYRWFSVIGSSSTVGGVVQTQTSGGEVTAHIFNNSTAGYIGTGTNHPLVFRTNAQEKMRIDSSGNVGIGTSSPSVRLDIRGGDLAISRSAAGVAGDAAIYFGSTSNNYIYGGNSANIMAFAVNGSERIRIDSNGNVGIGTASPAAGVHIADKVLRLTSSSGNPTFQFGRTNGFSLLYDVDNDRFVINRDAPLGSGVLTTLYIDSAGNVGVNGIGTEAAKFKTYVDTPQNAIWAHLKSTAHDCTGFISYAETGVYNFDYYGAWNSSGNQFRIDGSGNISTVGNVTAYVSDRRLKTDIKIIPNALDKVMAISGITYKNNDLAASYGYTSQESQAGVLAQEIENVLPEVVKIAPFDAEKASDGSYYSKSGENYKTVQYERIVPLLIEAIKELKAEIEQLKGK